MKKQYLYPQNMRTEAKLLVLGTPGYHYHCCRTYNFGSFVGKAELHYPRGSYPDIRILVHAPR